MVRLKIIEQKKKRKDPGDPDDGGDPDATWMYCEPHKRWQLAVEFVPEPRDKIENVSFKRNEEIIGL